MKRRAVLIKIKQAAESQGLVYSVESLTRHDAVRVGQTCRTIGRHSQIDEITARKFFAQFENELGNRWWR